MARGSKPGERRGGRTKGTKNKKSAVRALAIELAGIEPKAFLLNGLAFYQAQIQREFAKGKAADLSLIEQWYSAGREIAKDVAPYCHSRLPQAIQLGNTSTTAGDGQVAQDAFRIEYVPAQRDTPT